MSIGHSSEDRSALLPIKWDEDIVRYSCENRRLFVGNFMSDATLRYHIAQTKKYHQDANYTRKGWRVKYKKVQE